MDYKPFEVGVVIPSIPFRMGRIGRVKRLKWMVRVVGIGMEIEPYWDFGGIRGMRKLRGLGERRGGLRNGM